MVFEGKNKEYGAYEMRNTSASRHTKAVLIVAVIAIVAFSIPILIKFVVPKQEKEVMTEVTTLSQLPPPEVPEELKKPTAPPPPPLKSTIKFTPPVIKKDEEVNDEDQMKSQEELTSTKLSISIADVKGNDEINGQDIADLRVIAEDKPVEEKPLLRADQMPEFPGGVEAMMKYIYANIQYPKEAIENGIQGRVTVQFVVSKTGAIEDINVIGKLDPVCDKEAVRVIQGMPKWIPGKQNGKAVPVYFIVPVIFKLQE